MMRMRVKGLFAVVSCALPPLLAVASGAIPVVSNVKFSQDSASRKVEISYELDSPAIVTVDFLTNGVSIGEENFRNAVGDLNRLVMDSGKVTWTPYEGWGPASSKHSGMSVKVTAWATNAPPDWMIVDLMRPGTVNYYTSTNAMPNPDVTDDIYKTEKLLMRKIPARFVRWRQGAPKSETGALDSWGYHLMRFVTLTHDYYIGVYQVTQRQYELMINSGITTSLTPRPSAFKQESDYATRPVDSVSYDTIRGNSQGLNWPNDDLRVAHGVDSWTFMHAMREWTGLLFDLPTEAQWEFAARGGEYASSWHWGDYVVDSAVKMNPYMRSAKNYGGNDIVVATCTADQGTAKVGSYLPNQYGLYDMYGNVREWCLDWSEREGESDNSEQIDPVGTNDGLMGSNNKRIRIYRGGGYSDGKANCNSTYRNRVASNTTWSQCGFRLAIPLYR